MVAGPRDVAATLLLILAAFNVVLEAHGSSSTNFDTVFVFALAVWAGVVILSGAEPGLSVDFAFVIANAAELGVKGGQAWRAADGLPRIAGLDLAAACAYFLAMAVCWFCFGPHANPPEVEARAPLLPLRDVEKDAKAHAALRPGGRA
jgi:hypothetical protein